MIDIHSHILPKVDDGAETLDASVAIIRELASQGVTDIIATPHFIDETIYSSARRENLRLLDDLRQTIAHEGIEAKLYLGNEIYINHRIDELIKFNRISTLAESRYLLIELPMNGEFTGYEDIFRDLIRDEYKVILAHPERYVAMREDFGILERLTEMGVLLQCNTGSFIRQYGKHAEKTAIQLAKRDMIFALGSDMHRTRGDKEIAQAVKKLGKYYSDEALERVLTGNAQDIIGVV